MRSRPERFDRSRIVENVQLKDAIVRVGLVLFLLAGCLVPSAVAEYPEGDANRDFRVDGVDLALLGQQWLSDPNDATDPNAADDPNDSGTLDRAGDINGDGCVNAMDLAVLASSWGQVDCPVVINELLAHSHDIAPDWIELYNRGSASVDLGGWTLSDSPDDLGKYRIPDGTVVEPNGYALFYEDVQFGNPLDTNAVEPFKLSENGETLYLYSAGDARYPDFLVAETFGASETNVTFGRYRKSTNTYNFVLMSEPTPGAANAYPLVGPLVINEIMYHPADDGDAEYVELLNISGGPVTLFDFNAMEPWWFTDDTGIDFRFPTDYPLTLEAGAHLLLTRDAAAVRASLGVPETTTVLQWDSGRLANSGEKIRLLKPGDVDELGTRYWIEIDCLNYSDGAHGEEFEDGFDPWPGEADGLGLSLNRLSPTRYGNDPNNWQATIPTPGSAND